MHGCILLLAMLSASGDSQAETTQNIEAVWRSEYPRAAARLEKTAQNFQASGTYTYRAFFGEIITTKKLRVASSGNNSVYVREGQTFESPKLTRRPRASVVRCRTAEYAFELTRQSDGDSYVIAYYADKFSDDVVFGYDYDIFARSATVYMQQDLASRMKSPSFAAKAVEHARRGVRFGSD